MMEATDHRWRVYHSTAAECDVYEVDGQTVAMVFDETTLSIEDRRRAKRAAFAAVIARLIPKGA